MSDKVKIGFISDLHTLHNDWYDNLKYHQWGWELEQKWNDLDLLIFAGDCSGRGSESDIDKFLNWFNLQPAKEKVMIAGNHDFFFDTDYRSKTEFGRKRHGFNSTPQEKVDEMLAKYPKIHYLNDSMVELYGLKIWGSPVSPWFHDWAFNRIRNTYDGYYSESVKNGIKKHWDMIPDKIDILVTHTPPKGHGDLLAPKFRRSDEHPNVGCEDLLEAIKRIKPTINVFGHIHEGYGITEDDSTKFINASCLNENYKPINPPIFLEL